ncbi:hypothetical protein VQ056_04435 [Paenibacillus sp. JTLBN-2024]
MKSSKTSRWGMCMKTAGLVLLLAAVPAFGASAQQSYGAYADSKPFIEQGKHGEAAQKAAKKKKRLR